MKKMMMAALTFLTSSATAVAASPCQKPLRFGWEPWEPYAMATSGGVSGIDGDIIKKVAEKAGCKVEFTEVVWARLLEDLKAGRIDGAMGISRNPEREQSMHFTTTYRNETLAFLVKEGESSKYKMESLADLKKLGIKIGVTTGYDYGEEMSKLMNDPAIKDRFEAVATEDLNIRKVSKGRIPMTIGDKFAALFAVKGLIAKKEITDRLEVHPFSLSSSPVHFALSKKAVGSDIVQALNAAIEELKKDGTLDKTIEAYTK